MIIEASIIFPIIILVVCAMLLASMYIYEKASLQASVETALTYYKNSMTDMWVESEQMFSGYSVKDSDERTGSRLGTMKSLTVFDLFGRTADKKAVIEQINNIYGFRNFSSGDTSIEVTQGGILFDKYIEVRVKDRIHFPINLSFVGVDNSDITYDLRIRENVSDGDQFVRDISVVREFVMHYVNQTELPDKMAQLKEKFKPFYDRFLDPKSSTGKANVYDSAEKGGKPDADTDGETIYVNESDVSVLPKETTTTPATTKPENIILDEGQYSVYEETTTAPQLLIEGPTAPAQSTGQTEAGYGLATVAPSETVGETTVPDNVLIVEEVESTGHSKKNTDFIDADFVEIE